MTKSYSYLYYGQLLVIATLPFHFLASSYAIILVLLISICQLIKYPNFRGETVQSFKGNTIAQLQVFFFFLNLLFFLIHLKDYENISVGLTSLEQKLSFLIFPILLAPMANYNAKQIYLAIKTYIFTIVASTLIALLFAVIQTLNTQSFSYFDKGEGVLFNNFMYHRLGSYVGMHAVYLAEYVLLALIMVISYSHYHFANWSFKYRLLSLSLCLYFISVIFLLKSASILFILMVIIVLLMIYYLFKAKEGISTKLKIITFIIGVIIVSSLTYRAIDKIGFKADYFTYDFCQPGGGEWNGINLRLAKWDVALQAISDHWALGVGPGNIISTLDTYYKKVGFEYALQLHYNPHNQFLHTFLALGIFGVLLLTLIFIIAIIRSIKRGDSVMFLFLISFLLFSLSESTLAVNKGVVFFTLFLSLFSYLPNKTSFYLDERTDQ